MKFEYFEFRNFKGISHLRINLDSSNDANVYTLVGLNESGKTTILEAIDYFVYKVDILDGLDMDRFKVNDIHDLIPINKRDNFNDKILVKAGLELEEDDIKKIKFVLKSSKNEWKEISIGTQISYSQEYCFENSKHVPDKNKLTWSYNFQGLKKRAKKWKPLSNDEALEVNPVIKKMIPSILYFPNFLFEFPEKILEIYERVIVRRYSYWMNQRLIYIHQLSLNSSIVLRIYLE